MLFRSVTVPSPEAAAKLQKLEDLTKAAPPAPAPAPVAPEKPASDEELKKANEKLASLLGKPK